MTPASLNPSLQAIIQTTAFYDAVGHTPLTALELYRRLIQTKESTGSRIPFADFLLELKKNWPTLAQCVVCSRGFYFLRNNSDGYTHRVQIAKTGIGKWRIAKKIARIVSLVPYVRMVAVTGSLALHMTHDKSDIDILIVAKHGHLWTTRILTSLVMQIVGKRRHGRHVKDRACLNQYISDSSLALRPKNLFSAHMYSTFLPLWSKKGLEGRFLKENRSWAEYYFKRLHDNLANLQSLKDRPLASRLMCSLLEFTLSYTIANFLEIAARFAQKQKIEHHLRDSSAQGEVIFDDEALVFHHPRPKDQEALHLYEENLMRIGAIYPQFIHIYTLDKDSILR